MSGFFDLNGPLVPGERDTWAYIVSSDNEGRKGVTNTSEFCSKDCRFFFNL